MSHTWGDRYQGERILVNGKAIIVSKTLVKGLYVLSRYPGAEKGQLKVWNDVLCLDQRNKLEVHREVKRMSIIFPNAYAIMAWIEPTSDDSHSVMNILERYNDLHDNPTSSGETLKSIPKNVWKALAYFLQRPFWCRLWIVQELTLAGSRTLILCGNDRARLRSLWKLVASIIRNTPRCHRLFEAALGSSGSYYDQCRYETFAFCARLYCLYEIDMSL